MRPELVLIKNSGGFMMHPTVNSHILILVPNEDLLVWNSVVYCHHFMVLPCMTAGLPIGITRVVSMLFVVPTYYGN